MYTAEMAVEMLSPSSCTTVDCKQQIVDSFVHDKEPCS